MSDRARTIGIVDPDQPTCARHPDVPTRVSCSSCDTPICPDCAIESAVGYKCPDCGTHGGAAPRDGGSGGGLLSGLGALRSGAARGGAGGAEPASGEGRLPPALVARATGVGVAAALAGGFVLGFVFAGRTFFLISSGVIGWAIARAVYWVTDDRTSPYVRAVALAAAGLSVGVGLVTAPGATPAPEGLLFLAYPAAVYGGWIVVRQR